MRDLMYKWTLAREQFLKEIEDALMPEEPFGFDDLVLYGIDEEHYQEPTLVQRKVSRLERDAQGIKVFYRDESWDWREMLSMDEIYQIIQEIDTIVNSK